MSRELPISARNGMRANEGKGKRNDKLKSEFRKLRPVIPNWSVFKKHEAADVGRRRSGKAE